MQVWEVNRDSGAVSRNALPGIGGLQILVNPATGEEETWVVMPFRALGGFK